MEVTETPTEGRRRSRRWIRIGIIVAVVIGALALVYDLALPHVVRAYIAGQLDDVAETLDRRISFEHFELERLNKYSFSNLVISERAPLQDRPFLTASRLTITLERTPLFAGQAVLRSIEIEQPTVYLREEPDGSSNYEAIYDQIMEALGLAEGHAAEPPAPSGPERDRGREGSGVIRDLLGNRVPEVRIVGGRVDTSEVAENHGPPGMDGLNVRLTPEGGGFACSFDVAADLQPVQTSFLLRPVHHLELTGSVDPDDETGEVMLGLGEPIEFAPIPGVRDLLVRVGSLGFEYPYTFRFRNVEVLARRTRTPVLAAPELAVSLRELTTDPEQFYISLVQADGMRLFVEMDRAGNTNIDRLLGITGPGPLTSLVPRRDRAVDEAEAGEPPEDHAEASAEDEGPPSVVAQEIRRRRWWEVAPQTTELTDVGIQVVVHEDDGTPIRTLDLEIPSITAAQRLLNFQMDVSSRIDMRERGAGPVGSLDVEFVYYYMTEHWAMDLDVHDLDIRRAIDVFPYPNPFDIQGGTLNGTLTVADARPERTLDVTGALRLRDFGFSAGSFHQTPLGDIDLSYAFEAALDGESNLTMSRGDLQVGSVEATAMLDLEGFDAGATYQYLVGFKNQEQRTRQPGTTDPLPWTRARLHVDVEPQRAMDIFEAVPKALRAGLEGTEMTGDLGFRLDAEANYSLDDRGRLHVDIPEPAVGEVYDEGVELVNLPFELDVRRLNEDFSFTFVDGIGEARVLTIGAENPRWVPLADISPMMIESILNTEDQNFCENEGFNWFQMRRVISSYLAEREFGRGASTVSMQLVKNVFLSRERLLSRKLVEMFLTYWMNRLVPKERILEVYLNVIEFGPGINGIAEAAEHYFGELPADLTLSQSTFLVSIVPNPRQYHFYWEQGAISDRWWEHMQRYIERMYQREVITQEQYEAALQDRPEFYRPAEGEPPLRPREPEEPELPPDWVLPFLVDVDAPPEEPPPVEEPPAPPPEPGAAEQEEIGWHCPIVEEE